MPKGKAGNHLPLDEKTDEADVRPADLKKKHDEKPDGEQQELAITVPAEPNPIRNGMMLAHFVKAHFDRDDGDRYIGFELSFPVTKDHQDFLPPEMQRGFRVVKSGNCKTHELESVHPQTVTLALVPDRDESDPRSRLGIILVAAMIDRATFSHVEESGAGKVKKIIRLKFKLSIDFQVAARDFATEYFGTDIWLSMKQTQESLVE